MGGVATQPTQNSSAADAVTELGGWLEADVDLEWPQAGSVDPGLQITMKELELEIKWHEYQK